MPPSLAAFLWLVFLVALFRIDAATGSSRSLALWVPVTWIFIVATRLPSQWMSLQAGNSALALEEGNPLDRSIYLLLMLLATIVLVSRSFRWVQFFFQNLALTSFLVFALVSATWSDYPMVCVKRWVRDFGSILVILVVLSDLHPFEAARTAFRWLCYLLIPLSILLLKYFPQIAMQYDSWTGAPMYLGPTTSKNMLGVVCLICAVFLFWDTAMKWADRKDRLVKRVILLNIGLIAMTLWVLYRASSATSGVCMALGWGVIVATRSRIVKRHPTFLKFAIPTFFFLYLVGAFVLGLNGQLAGAIGRDPTMTDRTLIWKTLMSMDTNQLIGTGYETFWLGSRLQRVWQTFGGINEAHNGYLEVYLNAGLVGLLLLIVFLIAGYKVVCRRLTSTTNSGYASLSLAFWTVLVFYNVTESAAFKFHPLWITFLFGVISVPEAAKSRASNAGTTINKAIAVKPSSRAVTLYPIK